MKTRAALLTTIGLILSLSFALPANAAESCNALASTVKIAQNAIAVAAGVESPASANGIDLKKLDKEAWNSAKACRQVAKFMGGGQRCGNVSKGKCSAGVQDTMRRMGIPMPRGNAIDQKGWLDKNFEKVTVPETAKKYKNDGSDLCSRAQPGVICLYSTSRHSYGHIEIKSAEHTYCSDFCTGRASLLNPRGKYKLVGVYRLKK